MTIIIFGSAIQLPQTSHGMVYEVLIDRENAMAETDVLLSH